MYQYCVISINHEPQETRFFWNLSAARAYRDALRFLVCEADILDVHGRRIA